MNYPDTWRYDHDLTKEELNIEAKYNEEMLLYMPRDTISGRWHDIYWLLNEWRNSSTRISAAKTVAEKHDLLGRRCLLSYYLDLYLNKVLNRKQI